MIVIGIVLMVIGIHLFFRFKTDWDEVLGPMSFFAGLILAITALTFPISNHVHVMELAESGEIWSCDAPYGRYWIDQSGSVCFLWGSVESTLVESYTVKYLVGDELKTMILSSTASNVHLHLTVNDTMYFEVWQEYADPDVGPLRKLGTPEYHIYVPDPKLLPIGEE